MAVDSITIEEIRMPSSWPSFLLRAKIPRAGRETEIAKGNNRLWRKMVADLDDTLRPRGWCYEVLRRWPHNPILLRQTGTATSIDDAHRPPPQTCLHFGGELHACAGRALNRLQIPMLMFKILARYVTITGPIRRAGSFPDNLPIKLRGN